MHVEAIQLSHARTIQRRFTFDKLHVLSFRLYCVKFGLSFFSSVSLRLMSYLTSSCIIRLFFLRSLDALVHRLSIQRVLDVSADWTEDSHESQYSSIQYDFRVTCDAHYYGQGCANLCRPRDDQFGHYTCSSSGNIVCLSGWQGDYCTKGKPISFTK